MSEYEKLKEAFERIEINYHCSFGGDNEDLELFKELVEKEKPKTPELFLYDNGQGDMLLCPNCRKDLGHPLYIKKDKIYRCPQCGQKLKKLDWGDE